MYFFTKIRLDVTCPNKFFDTPYNAHCIYTCVNINTSHVVPLTYNLIDQ